ARSLLLLRAAVPPPHLCRPLSDRPPMRRSRSSIWATRTPAMRARFAALRQPGEHEADETLIPLPPYLESRRRHVMAEPGFWRELAPRAADDASAHEIEVDLAAELRVHHAPRITWMTRMYGVCCASVSRQEVSKAPLN